MFQSILLEDESFLNEVHSYIQAGTGAAEAINRVGQRYADKLLAMTDNSYLQLRNVDILDATQRCDQHPLRPAPDAADFGSPGDPGRRPADAQRPVQHPGGDDSGDHHLRGAAP